MGDVQSMDNRSSSGLRRSPFNTLTPEDIEYIKSEIQGIGADESKFIFNRGARTSYSDKHDLIFIRGDVFPDTNSLHPRDLMSERAVIAHEYYGHRAYRNTSLPKGSWNDEFRASYIAALTTPNLSSEDRRFLMLDAVERAKEAGVRIEINSAMRRYIYGY